MSLEKFPFDRQVLCIGVESGAHEAEEVILDAQELPDLVPIEGDKILCLKCKLLISRFQGDKIVSQKTK